MLKSFFKTILPGLLKNKSYSCLNIFGLAIGIACAGLILLRVEDELNWDNNNVNKKALYAMRENATYAGNTFTNWSTPNCIYHHYINQCKLPGNKSRSCKSCEEFENGVINLTMRI